jgi:hypothetical protein
MKSNTALNSVVKTFVDAIRENAADYGSVSAAWATYRQEYKPAAFIVVRVNAELQRLGLID